MCDVVNHVIEGRVNDKERILAYNIGLAIHDVNYGMHIYDMIKDEKQYFDFDMLEPDTKFWV